MKIQVLVVSCILFLSGCATCVRTPCWFCSSFAVPQTAMNYIPPQPGSAFVDKNQGPIIERPVEAVTVEPLEGHVYETEDGQFYDEEGPVDQVYVEKKKSIYWDDASQKFIVED